jgi:hypothetical protein
VNTLDALGSDPHIKKGGLFCPPFQLSANGYTIACGWRPELWIAFRTSMSMGSSNLFFVVKWSVPLLVALQLATNHYVRDAVGALERQLEEELITPHDYSLLNAFYFFPNIITPMLAGIFVEKIGGVVLGYIYSLWISLFGHLIFSLGIQYANKSLMLCGKALSGSMYEILDALMPILYLGALYKDDFQLVVGFMQIFIRLGSVVNFFVTPRLYAMYGLNIALWVASIVGMSGLVLFVMARYIEVNWYKTHPDYKSPSTSGESMSSHGGSTNEMSSNSNTHNSTSTHDRLPLDDEVLEKTASPFTIETEDHDDDEVTQDHEQSQKMAELYNERTSTANEHSSSSPTDREPLTKNITVFQRLYDGFMNMTQFDKFDAKFYFYFSAGSLLYGAVVPFWFFGSKYLQENFNFSVERADSLVSIPELCMVFVGFPLGLTVTRYKWSYQTRLHVVCGAMFCIFLAFCILLVAGVQKNSHQASGQVHSDDNYLYSVIAVFAVLLLGSGFSFSCSLFWGCINGVVDSKYFNEASGLTSCGVNVLPSILPPILVSFRLQGDHQIIACIAILALLGSICAYAASGEETSRRFATVLLCRRREAEGGSLGGYSQHGLLESSQHNENHGDYEMVESQMHHPHNHKEGDS